MIISNGIGYEYGHDKSNCDDGGDNDDDNVSFDVGDNNESSLQKDITSRSSYLPYRVAICLTFHRRLQNT